MNCLINNVLHNVPRNGHLRDAQHGLEGLLVLAKPDEGHALVHRGSGKRGSVAFKAPEGASWREFCDVYGRLSWRKPSSLKRGTIFVIKNFESG